jgi:hypothetical protein
VLRPLVQGRIVGEIVFHLMDIAQEMHPAALMASLMDVVSGIGIAAQHSLERTSKELLDHFPSPRVMIFVIADARCRDAPDIAMLTVLPPSRFIGLHGGAGLDGRFQSVKRWLGELLDAVEQLHQFPQTEHEAMQIAQHLLDLAQGQTHHGAQVGDDAGKPHPKAALSKDLLGQVYWGFIPALTARTPSLEDAVVGDFDTRHRWHIDDFPHACQAHAP